MRSRMILNKITIASAAHTLAQFQRMRKSGLKKYPAPSLSTDAVIQLATFNGCAARAFRSTSSSLFAR